MEPEEMDVVELLEDVPVEPAWRVKPEFAPAMLQRGERGVVVHCHEHASLCEVEFRDETTGNTRALATLRADQLRVVERYTLEE